MACFQVATVELNKHIDNMDEYEANILAVDLENKVVLFDVLDLMQRNICNGSCSVDKPITSPYQQSCSFPAMLSLRLAHVSSLF